MKNITFSYFKIQFSIITIILLCCISSCTTTNQRDISNKISIPTSYIFYDGKTLDKSIIKKYNSKYGFLKNDGKIDNSKLDNRVLISIYSVDDKVDLNAAILKSNVKANKIIVHAYWISSIKIPCESIDDLEKILGVKKDSFIAERLIGFGVLYEIAIQSTSAGLSGNYMSIINAGINHQDASIEIQERSLGANGTLVDAMSAFFNASKNTNDDVGLDMVLAILNTLKQYRNNIDGNMRLIGYEITPYQKYHFHTVEKETYEPITKKVEIEAVASFFDNKEK
jgi:hypothetical protein